MVFVARRKDLTAKSPLPLVAAASVGDAPHMGFAVLAAEAWSDLQVS